MLMWRSCADKEYKCSLELGETLYMQTYRAIHMPENQQNSGETHLTALQLHQTLAHTCTFLICTADNHLCTGLGPTKRSPKALDAGTGTVSADHEDGGSQWDPSTATTPPKPSWLRSTAWGTLPWATAGLAAEHNCNTSVLTGASCREGGIPPTRALCI